MTTPNVKGLTGFFYFLIPRNHLALQRSVFLCALALLPLDLALE